MYSAILKYIILPLADHVMNTKVISYYRQIKKMNTWSREEIESWQNKKIAELIKHAYNNTIYYKELFDKNFIDPNTVNSKESLKQIPVLTKQDIIKNYERLIPANINKINHKLKSTGGSTGDPLKYLLDNDSWSFTNANYIFNWEQTTYKYGNKFIALGSSSINISESQSLKHKIYYALKNKIGLDGVNMSIENCKQYVKLIQRGKIKYIYGYASAIYLLAKYVDENKIKTPVEACFTTSEILLPHYREVIIKAFNCDVVNCYGANDGGVTAYEHDIGYFLVGYNCIVSSQSNSNKEVAPALLTDLTNYAMPFINYQLGDEIQIDTDQNREYAYNGQIINKIGGRTSDVIRLENGSVLTGPGFTVLFGGLPVVSYSIRKNGKNKILCLISKAKGYNNNTERTIFSSIQKKAGADSIIELEYLDELKISKSGKKEYFLT